MITQVTITSSLRRADTSPATGTLEAAPVESFVNDGVEVGTQTVIGQITGGILLTADGDPFTLAALDDTDTTPKGLVYSLILRLDGMPPISTTRTISHTESPLDVSTIFSE